MCEWICEHLIWDVKQRSCKIEFLFLFFICKAKPILAEIPIPPKIGRNWPKWPNNPETGWNLTWGGMGGSTIPDCTLAWQILAVQPERNKINNIGLESRKVFFKITHGFKKKIAKWAWSTYKLQHPWAHERRTCKLNTFCKAWFTFYIYIYLKIKA